MIVADFRIFRTPLYVNKRGNEKTIQTIHKTLHKPYISLILRALRNVQFALQTIHKLYTNPTLRVKETKSQRDKETKGERRKDRLFETLMFMNYSRIDHELIF